MAGAVAVSDPLGVGVGSGLGVGVGLDVVGVGVGVWVGLGVGLGVVGVGVGVCVGDLAGLGLGEAVRDFDGFGWLVCRTVLGLADGVWPAWAWRSWAPLRAPPRGCPAAGGLADGPAWPRGPPAPAR